MSDFKPAPWVPAYWLRKYFTSKIRKTEEEIRLLKANGDWTEASKKEYKLRNSWWGYKKFK